MTTGPPPAPGLTVAIAWLIPDSTAIVGIAGGATGVAVTWGDVLDVPEAFVAVVLNVYNVLLAKPVIVHDVAGVVTVQVKAPGSAVTV